MKQKDHKRMRLGKSERLARQKGVAALFVAIMLFVFSSYNLGYVFGQVATPSFDTTIEPGSLVASATFILFEDGGSYFVRNGYTGAIDYDTTDGDAVIQWAIDNVPDDQGKILLRKGNYTIDTTINLRSHVSLIGEGWNLTVLYAEDGFDDEMLYSTYTFRVELAHMTLDGNNAGNTIGTGIYGTFAYGRIHDLYIVGFPDAGIYLNSAVGGNFDNYFYNLYIYGNDVTSYGIRARATDNLWQNIVVAHMAPGGSGIRVELFSQVFSNVYMYAPGAYGFDLRGDLRRVIIDGANIVGAYNYAIFLTASTPYVVGDIVISGVQIYQPAGLTFGYGIVASGTGTLDTVSITDVTMNLDGGYDYGVHFGISSIQNVSVSGLSVDGAVIYGFYVDPTSTINNLTTSAISTSTNYRLENAGEAVFSGDAAETVFVFVHGLFFSPVSATVTACSTDARGDYSASFDATNITVTYTAAPPSGSSNVELCWYARV